MRKSKKAYEEYLNILSPPWGSDEWIIGGVKRTRSMNNATWGTALRKHDPIAFEVGYKEWCRE